MSFRLSALYLGFVAFAAGAFAASGSFTIDQVMSAPFASTPVAAPTGTRVAWLLNERGQRNIWVAAAPDWKGHKITTFNQDDGQDIADLAWAPDGTYLLFARGGDFENGGDNPNPDLSPSKPDQSIWSVAMDGAPAKKLTEGRAPAISPKGDIIAFIRGGQIFVMQPSGEGVKNAVTQKATASELRWSPDGADLAFVSNRQNHELIGVYRPADRTLRYLDASVDRDSEPVWSPDGAHIAYIRIPAGRGFAGAGPRREGNPWSIRIADARTGFGHEVFRAKPGPGSIFHRIEADQQLFWASNDRLVFPWELSGWCHLYSMPAAGESYTELTPGEGEVEHVSISHDGKSMFYSTNIGDVDRRHVWEVSVAGNATPKQITTGEQIEWAPTPTADGSALVFLASSYNERAHAAVRTSNGHIEPLAPETVPSEFPASALVRPLPVLVTAADGMVIHGQLFLPKENPGQRHPALVFFHGGSRRQMLLGFHYMYYYSNAYSLNQYLASQGYVVLSVNYRSGIGYGLNFREAINYGARGGSEFNDVIGAGLFLKSRPDVDPKRIGVWGGSYGGYLTAMALSRASDLFAAGVDFHGVHDWSSLRGGNNAANSTGDPTIVREQQEAARIAFESSPMSSVKTWKSPVLLIHGDDDRNVNFGQTVMLVEALREQHVDFEQLIIPNEIHDFLMYQHWVEAYKATADFFARKLQNAREVSEVR
ncbi:MAG TPA: prolyl oligopeptidase family serine peptidase [Bryobacteraceae bacterium]|nr:prolyl oligopeptidase family serine peptidase [Bryobacteraceae bacterium]